MPYTKNRFILEKLIRNCLAKKEIKESLPQAGLTEDFLFSKLMAKEEEIWSVAANEILDVNRLEEELKHSEEIIKKNAPTPPKYLDSFENSKFYVLIVFPMCIMILLIMLTYQNYISVIPTVLTFVGIGTAVISVNSYFKKLRNSYKEDIDRFNKEFEENINLKNKQNSILFARLEVDNAIVEKGILPEIRPLINDHLKSQYSITLSELDAPGLAEVFDPAYEIVTKNKNKLYNLLNKMPGGSIGISGPRGAGKTTLLWSISSKSSEKIKNKPVRSITTSAPVEYNSREFILHIFSLICKDISGKTEPNPRMPLRNNNPSEKFALRINETIIANLLQASFISRYILSIVGLLLLLVCIFISREAISYGKNIEDLIKLGIVPEKYLAYGIVLITINIIILVIYRLLNSRDTYNHYLYLIRSNDGSNYLGPKRESLDSFWSFRSGLFYLFVFGISLILFSIYLSYQIIASDQPGYYIPIDYINILQINSINLLTWGIVCILFSLFLHNTLNSLRSYMEDIICRPENESPKPSDIRDEAITLLEKIKFQQSYSSGWSGSLKLPVGVEGSINSAISLAENQLSLPEIVTIFRNFLEKISKDSVVIIGIDELDKLNSDEEAQRFLNEIKAIFGIKNVFYLVSVSENAMSSFERRGLPFRDAFDSSFDKILYVDYLNLEGAKQLIQRRVIGFPIPFLCLCYCMSGGLARDMIRICRDILDLVPIKQKNSYAFSWDKIPGEDDQRLKEFLINRFGIEWAKTATIDKINNDTTIRVSAETNILSIKLNDKRNEAIMEINYCDHNKFIAIIENNHLNIHYAILSEVAFSLIVADLKSKLKATSIAAKGITLEPYVNAFYEKIHQLEFGLESQDSALESCWNLCNSSTDYLVDKNENDSPEISKDRIKLASLEDELKIYFYYSLTLIEFFNEKLDANLVKRAEKSCGFDHLARARQFLSISPCVTQSVITEFRKSYDMRIPIDRDRKICGINPIYEE
jgi:Cdc6-like AAA superfamily ATPase